MLKMPEKQRIQEIADMIPEWISIFSDGSKGYNARIAQMGALMQVSKIALELGIKMPMTSKFDMNVVIDIMEKYDVPDILVLKTPIGRLRVFFYEGDINPVFDLRENFGDECMNGYVYAISRSEVPSSALFGLKNKGIIGYKNLITKTVKTFKIGG